LWFFHGTRRDQDVRHCTLFAGIFGTDSSDRALLDFGVEARIFLSPQWVLELYNLNAAFYALRFHFLWLGLRYTRLHRESVFADGSVDTAYDQAFTTPWLALSYRLAPATTAYASWGQGIESAVVPNLPSYNNPGQPLPALKSHQIEAGIKHGADGLNWSAIAFDIDRPLTAMCPALHADHAPA
jgi:hypothetical protein